MQYYGWALQNRATLMPTREQVEHAVAKVEALRGRYHGRIVIDAVVPDYYARFPKPCVGGWARRSLNVTPSGRVLPCHAAESDSRLGILVGARASAAGDLGELARLQCVPRHRLDAGALRQLRLPRAGFRRLPLPGVLLDRRRAPTDPVCQFAPNHAMMAELATIQADAPYVYRR